MMETGIQNGLPTNHERDAAASVNGGASFASQPSSAQQLNGAVAVGAGEMTNGAALAEQDARSSRMNDLPDEIQHITQGYISLGMMLSRLAQRTHNQLEAKVLEMAKMPVPAAAMNGNSAHPGGLPDDDSVENARKKQALLQFIQKIHGQWTKALVITAWSRKASTVSKLIDLMNHINMERKAVDDGFDYLVNIKRNLAFARLPNPDLQTALQVLATGDASWMPDLGFIEPPPLSADEQLKWIEELNTLLSLRLNLEEHDKIPYHFRDYIIDSGRVTFKVEGEFEVDLTIADEDFEKQFWFLDFRFAFSPAPAELTETLRMFIESRVNEALEKDGLLGCYNFLHEFVLTHKISEYVRQGRQLARGTWVDTLKIERLNRSMAIQYWTNRYSPESPKSWLIVGVHSGKKPGAAVADPKATSYLTLRWFRDNREIKDVSIAMDDTDVNTERLLKRVIARHVEYILSSIHGKLQSKGRFLKRQAALSLHISHDEPVESSLKMQLGCSDHVTVRIVPTTGFFSMTPQRIAMYKAETRLNSQPRDPTDEGLNALESVRYSYTMDEMNRRGRSMGWTVSKTPIKVEEIKPILQSKEPFTHLWFRRKGWPAQWFLMLTLSMAGDRWWLIEVSGSLPNPHITSYAQVPLSSGSPDFTDRFFSNLTTFSAAMISHATDVKMLIQRRIKYSTVEMLNQSLPPSMKLPALWMCLSDILSGRGSKKAWAADYVQVMFKGLAKPSRKSKLVIQEAVNAQEAALKPPRQELLTIFADARFKVADRSKFSLLKGNVEQDVAFNPRLGVFALRLKAEVGSTLLDDLASRIQAIERLVDCVDAIRRSSTDIQCETIALREVVFTYSDAIGRVAGSTAGANIKRWKASLDLRGDKIKLSLEKDNPHLRVLDSFNKLLNSDLGFTKVPQYLAFTLPVLKALDVIEESWQQMEAKEQVRAEIFSGYLDWYTIRYTVPTANKKTSQFYHISIRLKHRRGLPWWHVSREEPEPNSNPDDELKSVLAKVWGKEDKTWQSFGDSASCEANDTVHQLLGAVDAAVQQLALRPLSSSPALSRKTQPTPKMKQQPTPKMNNMKMQVQNRVRPPQQKPDNVITLDD